MKGLLLKDWCMMCKYCRTYLLIAVVFVVISFATDDNLFFVFYPCLLCGMIPVNLLAYDERSGWIRYSATLPYTKAQLVSVKYLIGLLSQIGMMLVIGTTQTVKMIVNDQFVASDFMVLMSLLLVISTISSSITLPFIFKWGVEKGRMAYYIMIGFVCAASVLASNVFQSRMNMTINFDIILFVAVAVGIVIYSISWWLSIVFYKQREII